jgi:hypothetical protein
MITCVSDARWECTALSADHLLQFPFSGLQDTSNNLSGLEDFDFPQYHHRVIVIFFGEQSSFR